MKTIKPIRRNHGLLKRIMYAFSRNVLGYSGCMKCGATWNMTEPHVTTYIPSHGCFPLCEDCWRNSTASERVPYYRELICDKWHDTSEWPLVEAAVMEGK